MGAWGLGLFENDSDLDHVGEFSDEAGIDLHNHEEYESGRRILDSGVLVKMVQKRMADATDPSKMIRGWGVDDSPDYKLVILGACAMQVGAKLPKSLRDFMEAKWREFGLQRDGCIQIEEALRVYEDGVPFNFNNEEIKRKIAAAAGSARRNNQAGSGSGGVIGLNTLMPGRTAEQMQSMREAGRRALAGIGWGFNATEPAGPAPALPSQPTPASPIARPMSTPAAPPPQHPADSCGFCSSRTGSHSQKGRLLNCAGCHKQLYCSKPCQKSHWKWHKSTCKV